MSSSNHRRRHHKKHHRQRKKHHRRYIRRCVKSHERFHFDEIVNDWRFLETNDRNLSRVIAITFTTGTEMSVKINQINNIIKYSVTIPTDDDDEDDNDEEEIHVVESLLNNGKVVRFRFNGRENTGGESNAKLFYDALAEKMNLPVGV